MIKQCEAEVDVMPTFNPNLCVGETIHTSVITRNCELNHFSDADGTDG